MFLQMFWKTVAAARIQQLGSHTSHLKQPVLCHRLIGPSKMQAGPNHPAPGSQREKQVEGLAARLAVARFSELPEEVL